MVQFSSGYKRWIKYRICLHWWVQCHWFIRVMQSSSVIETERILNMFLSSLIFSENFSNNDSDWRTLTNSFHPLIWLTDDLYSPQCTANINYEKQRELHIKIIAIKLVTRTYIRGRSNTHSEWRIFIIWRTYWIVRTWEWFDWVHKHMWWDNGRMKIVHCCNLFSIVTVCNKQEHSQWTPSIMTDAFTGREAIRFPLQI